jgi:hypothetical protein
VAKSIIAAGKIHIYSGRQAGISKSSNLRRRQYANAMPKIVLKQSVCSVFYSRIKDFIVLSMAFSSKNSILSNTVKPFYKFHSH